MTNVPQEGQGCQAAGDFPLCFSKAADESRWACSEAAARAQPCPELMAFQLFLTGPARSGCLLSIIGFWGLLQVLF